MARKPRLHVPGGFYHVILKGNGGQDIFFTQEDTKFFESLVSEGVKRFGHRIHCYCWMKNHVHLIVQIANTPLPKIIQNISFRYTLYVNNTHSRSGHLFQGRYKAILIDPQNYLLELVRYIDLNPVRAKIVSKPEEYKWSSHRAYLGKSGCEWLTTDFVLRIFSTNENMALEDYRQFVLDGMKQVYGKKFNSVSVKGEILGSDNFIEEALRISEVKSKDRMSMEKIVTTVCRRFNVSHEELAGLNRNREFSKIRTIVGYLVMEYGNCSLAEYCRYVRRDISTLSSAVRSYRDEIVSDSEERSFLTGIKTELGLVNQ